MSTSSDQDRCARSCWFAAALTGVLVSLLLMFLSGWSFISAFILGFIAAMIVGFGARAMLCSASQAPISPVKPAPAAEPAKPAVAKTPPAAAAPVAPAATAKPASQDPVVKPSTALPGQADLAARKGSWKYGADAAAAPAPAPAPVASGAAPAALDGPRDGKADDLTRIKGVGPKLNQLLNSMGYHHFDQIAAWTGADVAWMDENLQGFRGRVTRDDWVAQAKILAAGGETEFSKRQS